MPTTKGLSPEEIRLAIERMKETETRLRAGDAPLHALYMALVGWIVLVVTWEVTQESVRREPLLLGLVMLGAIVFGLLAVGVLFTRSRNEGKLRQVLDRRVLYETALSTQAQISLNARQRPNLGVATDGETETLVDEAGRASIEEPAPQT